MSKIKEHNAGTNLTTKFDVIIIQQTCPDIIRSCEIMDMKRVGSRFDKAIDMDPNELAKHAQHILKTRSDDSRFCLVIACGGGEFEVKDEHVKFPVTLSTMICG